MKVNSILFVIVIVGEFDKAEECQLPWLGVLIADLEAPYLIGFVQRHIIQGFRPNLVIIRSNISVTGSMMAYGLILIQVLAYRLPGA
ncbi:hypothetical protein D3C78_902270 [compost metagenome]